MSTKPIAFCAWCDSRILLIDTLQRSPVDEPPNTKHSSTNITYYAIGRGLITENILRQSRDHSNSIIASISEVDPGACFLNGDQGTGQISRIGAGSRSCDGYKRIPEVAKILRAPPSVLFGESFVF